MEIYVKPTNAVSPAPQGVNPPNIYDRQRVQAIYNGDTVIIITQARLANGQFVTPENSNLTFVLADDRFTPPEWTGTWRDGIEAKDINLVEIKIPNTVTARLRRGSFSYALKVADKLNANIQTVLEGFLLVEYATTSPTQSIPYKDYPVAPDGNTGLDLGFGTEGGG